MHKNEIMIFRKDFTSIPRNFQSMVFYTVPTALDSYIPFADFYVQLSASYKIIPIVAQTQI